MSWMPSNKTKIVVADTGPLIAFARLELFPLFPEVLGTVLVPDTVFEECMCGPDDEIALIEQAVKQGCLKKAADPQNTETEFPPSLGPGEQTAIALAVEQNCPVLIDDKLARSFARIKQLKVIGTVGILLKAKQAGRIVEVTPLFEQLKQKGYYIADTLIEQARVLAGE